MLYPLKFHPILKKKIWGGERLAYKSKEHDESIGKMLSEMTNQE